MPSVSTSSTGNSPTAFPHLLFVDVGDDHLGAGFYEHPESFAPDHPEPLERHAPTLEFHVSWLRGM